MLLLILVGKLQSIEIDKGISHDTGFPTGDKIETCNIRYF